MVRFIMMCVAAVFLTSGCARVPFTQALRQEHELSPDVLKKVQYYLSDTIVLIRESDAKDVLVSETHALHVVKENTRDRIIIRGGTPGVAKKIGPKSLAVSFEPGKTIRFGYVPEISGDAGFYVLMSQRGASYRAFGNDSVFDWEWMMKYGGETYRAVSDRFPVHLTVDVEQFSRKSHTLRTVEGLRPE